MALPAVQSVLKYDTAGSICNKVAIECGLAKAADPFQSTDPNFNQLTGLLGTVGLELLHSYQWQNLIQTYQFTTGSQVTDSSGNNVTDSSGGGVIDSSDTSSGIYPLPADFDSMIDQTGWAQNYHWPLRGPYSAQVWQMLVNYPAVGIYLGFRIEDNTVMVWPPNNTGQNISFKYMSRCWVVDGTSGKIKDVVSQSSDIVQFDWILVVKLLKVRWLEAKGFDTTAAANQFNAAWDTTVGKNIGAAPPLDLARSARFPYLSGYNVPDLGFGAPAAAGGNYQ